MVEKTGNLGKIIILLYINASYLKTKAPLPQLNK